jgi:hypothetical protein
VIFVVLLDEFDHFGQKLGDINVSLTLTVTMKGVASEIAQQSKTFGSNLPTALYFTVSAVFSRSCVHKPFIPVKVLCENVKYFHHNHFLVTKISAKKKKLVAMRSFLELDWRVFRNVDTFIVDDTVFYRNSKYCRVCGVVCSDNKP